MQSRRHSVFEATVNMVVGFVLSWAMWQFVVAPVFGYATTTHQSFWITVMFSATSWLRGYLIRRFFNRLR